MKYIGRRVNVGFGIEATRGTAVAVQNWQPKTDLSFDEKNEVIQDESSIGIITDSRDSFVAKRWAEGEISWNIETNSIGYLLLSVFGTVNSAVATTGAWTHTFELNETNQTQSLTVGLNDPVIGDVVFPLAMVESMTITAEEGAYATFSVELKGKPSESTTHTVTYAIDNKLLSRNSVFKMATNLAGLAWATASCLKSFEITFTKNLDDDYCLGSLTPQDFINKQFTIEGSYTALFTDETFRDAQLDGDHKAVSFQLVDTDTTIGVSSNPSLTFTLPLVSLSEFERSQGNDEVVMQTVTFKGLYSIADSSAVEVELTNTTEEYVA